MSYTLISLTVTSGYHFYLCLVDVSTENGIITVGPDEFTSAYPGYVRVTNIGEINLSSFLWRK